jgi:hypothetical protein
MAMIGDGNIKQKDCEMERLLPRESHPHDSGDITPSNARPCVDTHRTFEKWWVTGTSQNSGHNKISRLG